MNIPLFSEEFKKATWRMKFLARLALVLSTPLNWISPQRVEHIFYRMMKKLTTASQEQAIDIRNAVCAVSKRCRSQDGCIRRSLTVTMASWLCHRGVSWCTGFAQEPFRAHAWVEVNGNPIGEPEDIKLYTKTIDVIGHKPPDTVHEDTQNIAPSSKTLEKPQMDNEENEKTDKPVGISALFALAKGHNREFISVFILGMISALFTLVQPNLVAEIIEQSANGFMFNSTVLLLIGVLVLSTIMTVLQYYFLQKIGEGVVFEARHNLIRHIFHLPIREFDLRSVGDMLSRVNGDSSRLRSALIQCIMAVTSGLFVVIGAAVGMALRDLFLFVLTLITVGVALFGTLLLTQIVQRASFKAQEELGRLSGLVERDLHAIRTIRAANATKEEERKAIEQTEKIRKVGIRLAKIQALITPISNVSMQICGLIVLGIGGYRVSLGYMSISDLIAFALLLYTMIGPFGQIISAFSGIGESLGAYSRIKEFLDLALEEDMDVPTEISLAKEMDFDNSVVYFNKVSFGYNQLKFGADTARKDENMVLRSVTLKAEKGQRIAIVGPSGAGKSTILQLIERFYDPNGGQIFINGKNHRSLEREKLRSLITYVEQDAPIISGTLRENLTLENPEATDLDCERVLKEVNLIHLIERSDKGLDEQVGESGASLSGGERQRLAMARSLLSPAEIVLLDELTSNLDGVNEAGMKKAVEKMRGNKTVIVVAHRLSTVVDSDLIYVLEHGRVVGVGNHNQLIETVPLYRELAKEQFLV